ncbi:MAG: glycosyltransferase family 4 protein [Ktedonobacteraceae bacterium]
MYTEQVKIRQKTISQPDILMITPRYFPYMGGTETHVHEVGRRLASNGVNITLLTTAPHKPFAAHPREENIEGMRVIRVPAWPPERDYYLSPEIVSIINKGSWDLIHCQSSHTLVPIVAMLAAQRAGIPYLVTFHTGGSSSQFRTNIRDLQWKTLRPLFAGAAKLIGVSQAEANYFSKILRLPPERFMVIPNGATMPEISKDVAPLKDQTLIVSIGRLERYKGHQRIIAALPEIRKRRPDAHLLILGTGPYEAELHALAQRLAVSDHVKIRSIPAKEREVMATTLARAAVITLLSEYEAHPIAIMEALALHRPVLVAHTPGLRELAEQKLVRSVPLDSTEQQVADGILAQIEDPLVPTDFSLPTWEDCTQQLQQLYTTFARRKACVS